MNNEGNYLCQLSIVNKQNLMIESFENVQKSTVNFAAIAGDYQQAFFCAYFITVLKKHSLEMRTNEFNDDVLLSISH
jgi:hypothetical protein